MKVLVIGGGGREHALTWKIAQSPMLSKIYAVPGNPGIAEIADCRNISLADNFSEIAKFVETEKIDLTVVGPENPLADGIVDFFADRKLRAFGPNKRAAKIEASKKFAKELMAKNGIPTAKYRSFDNRESAVEYIKKLNSPVFVKADGLAAGKGAIPGETVAQAISAVDRIMLDRDFGKAGDKIVVEELMRGVEASFTVLSDGDYILPLVTAQDHKRALDGDQGENTGGMGAYSPSPVVTPELHRQVMRQIVRPTIDGMKKENRKFKGVLYVGLMIDSDGRPKVVEFNCRFGDPETQVILPRMKSDLLPLLNACVDGNLDHHQISWRSEVSLCAVMASGGYPRKYEKGKIIEGIDRANSLENVTVFHAGTKSENGKTVTNGGRVLSVTAIESDMNSAIEAVYEGVSEIQFEGSHVRNDIGRNRHDMINS